MFSFFKKKTTQPLEGFTLSTDIHSHVLPGIDDGSPDVETSIRLIKGMYDTGIRKMVATPHVISDLYRNTPESIHKALELLKPAMLEAGIPMELTAAAEYMIDDHFMQLLHQRSPLLTLHKNIILTEISYMTPPSNLEEMAFTIITEGYLPIMAHPERYSYYHHDHDAYYRLIELGFVLQVNLLSLTGYYGKAVAKAARFILDKGLAALVGTDLHHDRHLKALQDPHNQQLFSEYLSKKQYNDLESLAV